MRGTPAKSKRKPLHHVLRTAGTAGQFLEARWVRGGGDADAAVRQGERVQGSGFRERGQNAEVGGQGKPNSRLERAESRGQRSGGTGQPEQPFNARGARDAKGMQERGRFKVKGLRLKVEGAQAGEEGRGEQGENSLKHTGARPVDGAGKGQRGRPQRMGDGFS